MNKPEQVALKPLLPGQTEDLEELELRADRAMALAGLVAAEPLSLRELQHLLGLTRYELYPVLGCRAASRQLKVQHDWFEVRGGKIALTSEGVRCYFERIGL